MSTGQGWRAEWDVQGADPQVVREMEVVLTQPESAASGQDWWSDDPNQRVAELEAVERLSSASIDELLVLVASLRADLARTQANDETWARRSQAMLELAQANEALRTELASAQATTRNMAERIQRQQVDIENLMAERDRLKADRDYLYERFNEQVHRASAAIDREKQALQRARQATDLLMRLRGWDHLDGAADGPYWKQEIDKVFELAAERGGEQGL